MNEPSAFGRRLKQLRQEHGLTQDMLADRVGCATQTIRKIEAGSRGPSFQIAARLADKLGVGPEDRARFIRFDATCPHHDRPAAAGPETPVLPGLPAEAAGRVELERGAAPAPLVSLPTPLTRLIARDHEVMAVQHLLRRDDVRLLTLVGPGDGKTRLGLEVAAALVDHFADGVVFVNLVPIRDPALVVPTIADALGIGEAGGRPRIERLKAAFGLNSCCWCSITSSS